MQKSILVSSVSSDHFVCSFVFAPRELSVDDLFVYSPYSIYSLSFFLLHVFFCCKHRRAAELSDGHGRFWPHLYGHRADLPRHPIGHRVAHARGACDKFCTFFSTYIVPSLVSDGIRPFRSTAFFHL